MPRIIKPKSFSQKAAGALHNFKIVAFLGAMTLVLGLTYNLVTQKQDLRQNASFTSTQTFDPGYTTLIVLAANQNELSKYQELAGPNKDVSYRTVKFDSQQEISLFEQNNYRYFVTIASSDFIAHQATDSLYNYNIDQLKSIAANPGFKGFYLHEVLTYRSLVSSWNWDIARDTVDWAWVKQVVEIAKSNNKKVIWSEPTYAWKTMHDSQAVMDLFAQWGSTIVPMYATNFTQTEINSSKEFATKVAQKYTLALGQSHQGWYWQNSTGGTEPTREGSYNLALDGWNSGARYFQFEGNVNDFMWESPYMLGVRDFSSFLNSQYITPTTIPPTATPFPTATTSQTYTPTPSPRTTGQLRVETSPATAATIRILKTNGSVVMSNTWSIDWKPLAAGIYYIQFSYPRTAGLITPKTTLFRHYSNKVTEIIGNFKTGKTSVTYK